MKASFLILATSLSMFAFGQSNPSSVVHIPATGKSYVVNNLIHETDGSYTLENPSEVDPLITGDDPTVIRGTFDDDEVRAGGINIRCKPTTAVCFTIGRMPTQEEVDNNGKKAIVYVNDGNHTVVAADRLEEHEGSVDMMGHGVVFQDPNIGKQLEALKTFDETYGIDTETRLKVYRGIFYGLEDMGGGNYRIQCAGQYSICAVLIERGEA
ncbi:hypothetical protein [Phaeocystidibacter marisrubri]|uniref:Uncharacterized protein n=1 Tax=Phaeocystidibacter marisrubri TaxID=1577780 RepID=A0A6L3ZJY6_9FLAO|nr:hypothetical protein [Phaeocystidibacter marisrubri]KAB2817993.1 hypothetical protein F8C82_06205 [Phaeocystidibacter marisrubri]